MTSFDDDFTTCMIQLRRVTERDLPVLFEHQRQPEANVMASFPARDRDAFMIHWRKILADDTVIAMAVIVDQCVAGNVVSWIENGQRFVGYWLGQEHWGKGVGTRMLSMFLILVTDRPLYAIVAKHNLASIRILEKCRFVRYQAALVFASETPNGAEEFLYLLRDN